MKDYAWFLGLVTKMADMAIYVVKTFENPLLRTKGLMTLKLGLQHWGLRPYQLYPNDDSWLTLTYFKPGSNWVTWAFV